MSGQRSVWHEHSEVEGETAISSPGMCKALFCPTCSSKSSSDHRDKREVEDQGKGGEKNASKQTEEKRNKMLSTRKNEKSLCAAGK